jgi:hypothetical protein
MDNGSRSNRKLLLFVCACLGFCVGLAIGLLSLHDASTHPSGEWSKLATAFTFAVDFVIAFLLAAIAIFQPLKRMLVLAAMVPLLVLLPYASERAQIRTDQSERERLMREMTPRFSTQSFTSLAFHADLDALAPLGDGQDNAATWFRDFSQNGGTRLPEWTRAREHATRMTVPGFTLTALPPVDPLLREAEPWIDQATCRFYSEELSVEEQPNRSPNLDMIRMVGFSWVARGSLNQNIDDLSRAMRLGRLLRQDDVTLEQDQAAVELVHMAALAMNGMAVSNGDLRRSSQAAPVLTECSAIKLQTADRLILLSSGQITTLISFAEKSADRRFRLDAMRRLDFMFAGSNADSQHQVNDALVRLEKDPDGMVAATARWYLSAKREAPVIR